VRSLMRLSCVAIVGSIFLVAGTALAETADQTAISKLLHGMFDRPNAQLLVAPIVVSGIYAVAGWTQAEMGGRALLRKKDQDWVLILCAGDGIKSLEGLIKVGVPNQDAASLAEEMSTEEGKLSSQQVAMFSRFEGVMMMEDSDDHQHAHHDQAAGH
jgi:hypothetical protein